MIVARGLGRDSDALGAIVAFGLGRRVLLVVAAAITASSGGGITHAWYPDRNRRIREDDDEVLEIEQTIMAFLMRDAA